MKEKITIVGSGYVGMSLSVLFAQHNEVVILDTDPVRVEKVNKMQSTVKDKDIQNILKNNKLNLSATLEKDLAYQESKFIVVATPTNYDPKNNFFDTSSVDEVVSDALKFNPDALIIIKSTLPIGHTHFLQKTHDTDRIIFSPEFLREGHALMDNLYPSRIIIGSHSNLAKKFAELLTFSSNLDKINTIFISSTEAEAVKLFANSYLAMRVSFFNELDSFALSNDLDSKNIIQGVCSDDRIGNGYNNPSFGYGGYCLPKDTKQLLAHFKNVPQKLISSIVSSNEIRKDFISRLIIDQNPKVVGIFRLIMKSGSDNFRSSAVQGIINRLAKKGIEIIIYEPRLDSEKFLDYDVISDLNYFKKTSDLIIANRNSDEIKDVEDKCFSRDLFGEG